jgi:hypothetical protein
MVQILPQEITLILPLGDIRIKTYEGLIPICAWCCKVRDTQDHWHPLDSNQVDWFKELSTHTICPECNSSLKVS